MHPYMPHAYSIDIDIILISSHGLSFLSTLTFSISCMISSPPIARPKILFQQISFYRQARGREGKQGGSLTYVYHLAMDMVPRLGSARVQEEGKTTYSRNEELTSVGTWPGIRHRQSIRPIKSSFPTELVFEVTSPDRFSTGSIAFKESALWHSVAE